MLGGLWAQQGTVRIPPMRQLFHDNIDKKQQEILHATHDTLFAPTEDIDVNLQLTDLLRRKVDDLQAFVEADSDIVDNQKYTWLRSIYQMLDDFLTQYQSGKIKGVLLGELINGFDRGMQLELAGNSILPIIRGSDLDVGNILVNNFAFKNDSGLSRAREILVLKYCQRFPNGTMDMLRSHPDVSFCDSIVASYARKDPESVYSYGAAPDAFGNKIQANPDPLVQLIGRLSKMETGRIYFPFLDALYHHHITMEQIDSARNNDNDLLSLMVNTEIEYTRRQRNGDTPLVMSLLTDNLAKKIDDDYVTEINSLHDETHDAIRFKCLEGLSPEELYYISILAEEDIYTSSYLGVYNRIFPRMDVPRSDTLLSRVQFDHYRKFIKMAANYNTLDDFLKRMDRKEAEDLMKGFVDDLDLKGTLEDAVDVANSFASITDSVIKQLILKEVQKDLRHCIDAENYKGKVIYEILNSIFLSDQPASGHADSAVVGIPPVYDMPIGDLKDKDGKINIEQFFYGDKDGNTVFNDFISRYSKAGWRIESKPEWVEVSTTKGIPITIYSNKPLDSKQELDAQAQSDLNAYLAKNNIEPSITIHRGHSFWLNSTLKQLPKSSKVVLLGSCGGYQSLNAVLSVCPDAHIIASKQTGVGVVNIALIEAITETLSHDHSLDWPKLWKSLMPRFNGQYRYQFDDYVPPYRNLGAIFIMAYNKAMHSQDQDQ